MSFLPVWFNPWCYFVIAAFIVSFYFTSRPVIISDAKKEFFNHFQYHFNTKTHHDYMQHILTGAVKPFTFEQQAWMATVYLVLSFFPIYFTFETDWRHQLLVYPAWKSPGFYLSFVLLVPFFVNLWKTLERFSYRKRLLKDLHNYKANNQLEFYLAKEFKEFVDGR